MRHMKMIVITVALQYALTFTMMHAFDLDFLTLKGFEYVWLIVIPMFLFMSVTVLHNLFYLDKHIIDRIVEHEMEKRDQAFEVHSDEMSIHQHEIFRDLQMIKVLAQDKKHDEIKDYIS